MTFSSFMRGVWAAIALGGALLLLKVFVDQKTLAIKASLNAPPSLAVQTRNAAPPPREALANAVAAIHAAVLSPDQVARLAPSGCLPGQKVAAAHAADFLDSDGKKLVADYGDEMTVDMANPSNGDRCNVTAATRSGSAVSGSIALADIGPFERVQAAMNARAIHQGTPASLWDLQSDILDDLPKRAQSMGVDTKEYYSTSMHAADYAAHCEHVSQEQLDDAADAFYVRRDTDNPIWKLYHDCKQEVLGTLFPGDPRGLYVKIALRSEKAKTPYLVTIEYQRLKDTDTDKPMKSRTIKEEIYDLFDIYGVGAYSVK